MLRKNSRLPVALLLILGLVLGTTGCGWLGDIFTPQPAFIPLPPPVGGKHRVTLELVTVGTSERAQSTSPNVDIRYSETGEGVGKVASQLIYFRQTGKSATMQQFDWGDFLNGRVRTVEYYDSQGNVLGAVVQLSVPDAALLQLAGARLRYLVDRSILDLVYVAPEVGARPQLTEFRYTERWGATDDDYWALGQTAYWRENLNLLPQSHHHWGFWERNASPFTLVTQALDQVRQGLSGSNPEYLIQDRDTAKEIIGRQSGFDILRSGRPVGTIHFEFTNLLGRQPNTAYISEGALSRIDWVIDGQYYGLVVLSPRISPRGSSLYVFVDDQATADSIMSQNAISLYEPLRQGMEHVIMAVYATGDIGTISDYVPTDEGGETVDIGEEGGVLYMTLNDVTNQQVRLAHNLVSHLGYEGIRLLGLHYASEAGSGSGLNYYLSTVMLATEQDPLDSWGADVGVLDRVGYPTPLELVESAR